VIATPTEIKGNDNSNRKSCIPARSDFSRKDAIKKQMGLSTKKPLFSPRRTSRYDEKRRAMKRSDTISNATVEPPPLFDAPRWKDFSRSKYKKQAEQLQTYLNTTTTYPDEHPLSTLPLSPIQRPPTKISLTSFVSQKKKLDSCLVLQPEVSLEGSCSSDSSWFEQEHFNHENSHIFSQVDPMFQQVEAIDPENDLGLSSFNASADLTPPPLDSDPSEFSLSFIDPEYSLSFIDPDFS
jgi:hypothetical protein